MKINVIGLGYIGLPTALMFASNGMRIVGTDSNNDLIIRLNLGKLTFDEKGLEELFQQALEHQISFTNEYEPSEIYIIAVPTPYIKKSKQIDPKHVISAVQSVLKVAPPGAIIVIESTVSPGTIDRYIRPVIRESGFEIGKDIHLAHAPERILPGNMVFELTHNSRTIGSDDQTIGECLKKIYSSFCKAEIVVTDIKTAEMTKVVENTYRDINIAFANELAKICNRDHMDVYEIIKIANKHPRVNILQPGPGVGGHCISVDPWFLVGDYPDLVNIILTARNINDEMPEYVLRRIREIMKANGIKDISRIGLYGLTYKEDVEDTRESPTLQLLEKMDEHLAFGIKSYDPFIQYTIVENQYFDFDDFLSEIDLIVVLVAHSHIKENSHKLKNKIIFDTRNTLSVHGTYKL
ncbi:nucleotide sugar dehydrogenase [Paenibacillus doosanensis]|uniref:nucleotide sugar dehydrogenase n=1 Tax=Paenibacillus doosanensis TaxID=1229154 RepID=UPI00217F9C1E|nr:nucleotide sugar dehydrogenase [Paenibacillus doosanensis]MCS7459888.1 nucleotide sugar dehydrogenase [Paenibacillus doosanensis]